MQLFLKRVQTPSIKGVILGDADSDNVITISDATVVQQHLARFKISNFNETAADVDGDNDVTIADATVIQQHLARIPTRFKIGDRA